MMNRRVEGPTPQQAPASPCPPCHLSHGAEFRVLTTLAFIQKNRWKEKEKTDLKN